MQDERALSKVSSNLTQMVVDAVAAHIREHQLRTGDALPSESALAQSVGVSRTVVREAFGALSALKLIDVGNGRRARVGLINGSTISLPFGHAVETAQVSVQQVWDARRTLERRTSELAALQRTKTQGEALLRYARAMRQASDNLTVQIDYDIAFHATIAEATQNPVFALLIGAFADLMRKTCPISWRSRRTEIERSAVFDQHDNIAEAINAGDAVAAQEAMDAHFELSLYALVKSGFN